MQAKPMAMSKRESKFSSKKNPAAKASANRGSALQINAWSAAGLYGERVRATAVALLRRAPKAVVASDAHGGERMPALNMAIDALARAGIPDPTRLVSSEPYALLEHGLAAPSALAA